MLDQERTLARQIETALVPCILLDRFPKSIIEIHVLIIESDGNELCCCINGTSLALINSGIDMVDLGVAVQCIALSSSLPKNNQHTQPTARFLVDPTQEELKTVRNFRTIITLMPKSGFVTLTYHQGESTPLHMINSLKICMDGCLEMYQQMRLVLIGEGTKRAKKAMNRKRIKETDGNSSSTMSG